MAIQLQLGLTLLLLLASTGGSIVRFWMERRKESLQLFRILIQESLKETLPQPGKSGEKETSPAETDHEVKSRTKRLAVLRLLHSYRRELTSKERKNLRKQLKHEVRHYLRETRRRIRKQYLDSWLTSLSLGVIAGLFFVLNTQLLWVPGIFLAAISSGYASQSLVENIAKVDTDQVAKDLLAQYRSKT